MPQSESLVLSGSASFHGELVADPFRLVRTVLDGKYLIEAMVASGGVSIVYRALHLLWGRPVAIKVFNPPGNLVAAQRSRFFEAFVREGAISAELSESSLAVRQAHDAGNAATQFGDRVPYLVLEWLEGEPLDVRLMAHRAAGSPPLSLSAAMELLSPVVGALSMAHDRGICHLDVKPGNLFVVRDERVPPDVKLIDFGVARTFGRPSTEHDDYASFRSFTPGYAAPEQFEPGLGPTGPWTDVFALSLILVELVTGHWPLRGAALHEVARAATDLRVRPTPRAYGVLVSDPVERVFCRALAVDPMHRFATAGSFWRALDAAAGTDGYPLPLCRGRTASDVSEHPEGNGEPRSVGGSRRARAVRTLAATVIFITFAFEGACVAKKLGWHMPFDANAVVRHLIGAARR
jgi:serine/threonine protein kinase